MKGRQDQSRCLKATEQNTCCVLSINALEHYIHKLGPNTLNTLNAALFSSLSSGVGACIFDPTSGEINFFGVGKHSRGCGAASALVAVAEEAMEVDVFFVPACLQISIASWLCAGLFWPRLL